MLPAPSKAQHCRRSWRYIEAAPCPRATPMHGGQLGGTRVIEAWSMYAQLQRRAAAGATTHAKERPAR
jgi:hypothetical protein